jgi:argonaute-like protein implicated in RNA metabolism and viral defense
LHNQVEHHDISKFSAEEFTQYRDKFFPVQGIPIDDKPHAFKLAWVHHYNSNTHHWESASTEIDVLHMIIDWTAMGYKFGDTAQSYYESQQDKIKLNPDLVPFMYQIFNALKDN